MCSIRLLKHLGDSRKEVNLLSKSENSLTKEEITHKEQYPYPFCHTVFKSRLLQMRKWKLQQNDSL